MIFPLTNQGQMADEIIGLPSGGAFITQLTNGGSYTVPAGMTLLIQGFSATASSGVSTLVIGGLTVASNSTSTSTGVFFASRSRLYPSSTSNLVVLTNSATTTGPSTVAPFGSTNGIVVAEHAPYLYWPLAAGVVISLSGVNPVFTFWGTLIPT